MGRFLIQTIVIFLTLTLCALSAHEAFSEDVKRTTKEELKAALDNPDLFIIDVRTGKDWKNSNQKIRGAVREDPKNIDEWADKYSHDKKIVLYCA